MPSQMIAIDGLNRAELLGEVTRCLFDQGVVLRDVTFGTYDERAELNAVGELANGDSPAELQRALAALPALEGATVKVGVFAASSTHRPSVAITHRVDIDGSSYVGLLSEVTYLFKEFGAQIVRFTAHRVPRKPKDQYIVRLSVNLPDDRGSDCMDAITATARVLEMNCSWWPA